MKRKIQCWIPGLVLLGLGLAGAAEPPDCSRPDNPYQVLDLHLEMSAADWDLVRRDSTFEIERPATFACGGGPTQQVKVRRKDSPGLPSDAEPIKVSLKIDFDDIVEDAEWNGHRKLSLENGASGGSSSCLVREGLSWHFFRQAGVVSGAFSWVHLTVNGQDLGVYTRVEQIDKSFLRRRVGEDEGFLYRIDYRAAEARQQLTRITEKDPYAEHLCFPPFDSTCPVPAAGYKGLGALVDLRQLLGLAAVNCLLANFDGPFNADNNVFWYNSARPRLYFPWDLDLTFAEEYFDWDPHLPPKATQSQRLLFADPAILAQFDSIVRRLAEGPLSGQEVQRFFDDIAPTVGAALDADPFSPLDGTFADEVARLVTFVTRRNEFVRSKLVPPEAPALVMSEVLAANGYSGLDEGGEAADWVEVLNLGALPIELSDFGLSDDPAEPFRWRFPPGKLAPGERLVVWCDHDLDQGPLHTGFQLNAAGDAVGLYLEMGGVVRTVDFVRFGPQVRDVSLGRAPEGGAGFFLPMECPTPGQSNIAHCDAPALFSRGEVNRDGRIDIADAVQLLGGLFLGQPIPCREASDANDDGALDLADAVSILGYLFFGRDPPPAPFPSCGRDLTGPPLGCEDESGCRG